MAGRVYICGLVALSLVSSHVSAIFLGPVPFVHPFLANPFLMNPFAAGLNLAAAANMNAARLASLNNFGRRVGSVGRRTQAAPVFTRPYDPNWDSPAAMAEAYNYPLGGALSYPMNGGMLISRDNSYDNVDINLGLGVNPMAPNMVQPVRTVEVSDVNLVGNVVNAVAGPPPMQPAPVMEISSGSDVNLVLPAGGGVPQGPVVL